MSWIPNVGSDTYATVVFIDLLGLRECDDAPLIPRTLGALHETLRRYSGVGRVLSTVTGAIVVLPDSSAAEAEPLLETLTSIPTHGHHPRVGVTHGLLRAVVDIDNATNLVGDAINTAARIATSKVNSGCLVHQSYVRAMKSSLPLASWHKMNPRTVEVKGKQHDPTYLCSIHPKTFVGVDGTSSTTPKWTPAVMIAYDLPEFSGNNLSEMTARFNATTYIFQQLRTQVSALGNAVAQFSPGGDGGILTLADVTPTDAALICARLQQLGVIGSSPLTEKAHLRWRLGVHYGLIAFFEDANGVRRPTGRELFVADKMAGDSVARTERYSGRLIMTRPIATALAGGDRERDATFSSLADSSESVLLGVARFLDERSASGVRPNP